ncbi:MAG: hypothetical protein JSS91_14115 [Bacteroidetes bacterium]|nr:hypothetical protein [Bacteroidota bacterium]
MLEYLNKLDENETRLFEKYVKSPFFNSNKNLITLCEYLLSLYPDVNGKNSSKQMISQIVYNERKINDVKIRKLLSDYYKLFDKFMIQLHFEKEDVMNKVILLNTFRKRGMNKRFELDYREAVNSQKKSFSKDDEYYINEVNLLTEYYYYNHSKYKNEKADCLQAKSDSLDMRYLFSKLHTFHEMFENEGTRNRGRYFNRGFYDEIMTFIENNISLIKKEHPNVYIIYLVLKMNESFNDDHLNQLQSYLTLNQKKFPEGKMLYYYNYITSYFIKKINAGHNRYRKDLMDIYKKMYRDKLFLIDNIITDQEYNSVVNTALAQKEYKWADRFIEEYKNYLEPSSSGDIFNLAKAKLLFHIKKYDEIFEYLTKIDNKDPSYYMNSKFLLGRVYFETKNFESLDYIIYNLSQYNRNKKILSSEERKSILNFILFMVELAKIVLINPLEKELRKSSKAILRKKLKNADGFVPGRNWFNEKLDDI